VELEAKKPKPSPRKKTGAARPRARKTPGKRQAKTKPAPALAALLSAFASRASAAGSRVAEVSGAGARASKSVIDRMRSEWKSLDSARKVEFVAALLAALAAASVPLARRKR
jgi:hypothetical protein